MNLHSKSYTVTEFLAQYFLSIDIGTRILTISEFLEDINASRGTVQNALQVLKDTKAIKLSTHGKLGTYLEEKNKKALLSFANIPLIIGVMPLPYSRLYEGLSSGIIEVLSREIDLPVNMTYMRGAQKRIEMVIDGRYDFAVVSKYSALAYMEQNKHSIRIAVDFGERTYLKGHALLLNDFSQDSIESGMRVGIDYDSIDQRQLTLNACKGKDVTLVPLSYAQFSSTLSQKEIDAAIWNADEVNRSLHGMKIIDIEMDTLDNTAAVMVVLENRREIATLLSESINIQEVKSIQNEVYEQLRIPQY